MSIDFRNTNTVWASILAATLQRIGLTTAVICPGSRSTPLTIAFAQNTKIEAIPILDERSAAFFALGIARKSGLPVAVICTSGTAGANFYPAIIEARESRVPLLILTADRPPELRDCHSGQTIDQVKLYGNYPNWQTELAVPSLDMEMLRYLRQTMVYAWERSQFPVKGPVHINLPFRDPLAPIADTTTNLLKSQFQSQEFFSHIPHSPLKLKTGNREEEYSENSKLSAPLPTPRFPLPIREWQKSDRGIIIAGLAQPDNPRGYCSAVGELSKALGFPVLGEGLSPIRNYAKLNPYLISTYDLILRDRLLAETLKPEIVIQIGELPTSKEIRAWLNQYQPQRWIIDDSDQNLDSLHGQTIHLRIAVEELGEKGLEMGEAISTLSSLTSNFFDLNYLEKWCSLENKFRIKIDDKMRMMNQLFEGKAAWLLSQVLPPETPLFIANSMPVRDVEWFWIPGNREIKPFFNRGANGIDGTLSTALGIAHRNKSTVILTGDLALLHDTNGFLLAQNLVGHLTILLINNNGGGIFEMLPISQFEPPFEKFFATPQSVNFAQLCGSYGVEHHLIESWGELEDLLNPLPKLGMRVLEIATNRKVDAKWRHGILDGGF